MSGLTQSKSNMALQFTLVAGVNGADTNIAITGIKTNDEILFVEERTTAASIASAADITANCSITSDGNIQSSSDTVNNQLFVVWSDNSI